MAVARCLAEQQTAVVENQASGFLGAMAGWDLEGKLVEEEKVAEQRLIEHTMWDTADNTWVAERKAVPGLHVHPESAASVHGWVAFQTSVGSAQGFPWFACLASRMVSAPKNKVELGKAPLQVEIPDRFFPLMPFPFCGASRSASLLCSSLKHLHNS